MDMPMGPPILPAFSLRVQLYAPNAYGLIDQPVRCFRVITSPESTVQQFCQEASRIHQMSYGQPIAIKRCQDDHGFDITQTEILGSLFRSMDTIRVIQASSQPNIRDSVPPTSALRFDPGSLSGPLGRKRDRADTGPKSNGVILPPSASYLPNKRQRISDFHPDHPLPSFEEVPDSQIVPDSQESIIVGSNSFSNSRQVRPESPQVRVAATPSPPSSVKSESPADTFSFKLAEKTSSLTNEFHQSIFGGRVEISPDLGDSNERAVAAKRKSASGKTKEHDAASTLESGEYDKTVAGDNEAAILKVKKAALKKHKSSTTNGKTTTPPPSQPRQNPISTEGTLTPNNQKQRQRKKEESSHARAEAARLAAEAAEKRKRDVEEEIRAATARKQLEIIETERLRRAESERLAKERKLREAEEHRVAQEQKRTEAFAKKKAESERILREKARELESAKQAPSSSPEETRRRQTSSPILPRAVANARAQSSTPFIPTGRKSSIKTPSINGSSPAASRASSGGTGIEDNMPLPPPKATRRVSFADKVETPVQPLKSCLSKKPSTPHPAALKFNSKSITPDMSPNVINPPRFNPGKSKSLTPDVAAAKAITPQSAVAQKSPNSVILPPVKASAAILPPVPSYRRTASPGDRNFSSQVPPKVSREAFANIVPAAKKQISPLAASKTANSTVLPALKDPRRSSSASTQLPGRRDATEPTETTESSSSDEDSYDSEPEELLGELVASAPRESAGSINNQADIETQSNNSSIRDSRSPVLYNELAQTRNQLRRLKSPGSGQVHKEVVENSDPSSDEDTEMPDVTYYDTVRDESSSGSENEVDDAAVQVRLSQPISPILPVNKVVPRLSEGIASGNRSSKAQPGSPGTDEEIENQLISSMTEALPRSMSPASHDQTTVKSKTNGNDSPSPQASIGFGASLKGMNQKKPNIKVSSFTSIVTPKNTKATLTSLLNSNSPDESDEESDEDSEESDSDTDSESSSDAPRTQIPELGNTRHTIASSKQEVEDSDSSSDDDSSSSSSSGSDEGSRIRKELMADIERMHSQNQSHQSSPSLATGPQGKKKLAR